MLGFFSSCCRAAVGRLVQQLCGKRSDLPVDVPNEVVDDADRVILDTAHFLGGPRKRPLSSRTLSGSWAIDLWTPSTVVAPFSIASAMDLTRVFRSAVRSVAIVCPPRRGSSNEHACSPSYAGRGGSAGSSHRRESRPPRVCQPENRGRKGFPSRPSTRPLRRTHRRSTATPRGPSRLDLSVASPIPVARHRRIRCSHDDVDAVGGESRLCSRGNDASVAQRPASGVSWCHLQRRYPLAAAPSILAARSAS